MKNKTLPAITIITGNIHTSHIFLGKKPLSAKHSQKVINHSPDGFSWGYGGSGPAQLALAILLTRTDEDNALRLYQDFKFEFVAKWPQTDFEVGLAIDKWLIDHNAPIVPNELDWGFDDFEDEGKGAPCGVRCFYAVGSDCDCQCEGENHGSLSPIRQLALY